MANPATAAPLVLSEGRIRLGASLPGAGPAVLPATDEEGHACFVEVLPEGPEVAAALHGLGAGTHASLPVVLDELRLEDGRYAVVEHPGPGRPLSEALGNGWKPWSAVRAGRCLERLCEGLELLQRKTAGHLPLQILPANLWLTPQGQLRLRTFGLADWGSGSPDPAIRMARAMADLVRVLRLVAPEAAAGEFLWALARCESADASRCYRSFSELGAALGRPGAEQASKVEPTRVHGHHDPPPIAGWRRPSQRPRWLAALLALALVATGAWWLRPGPAPVREPAMAVARGRRVDFSSLVTGTLLSRMELSDSAADLVASPDGRLLAASLPLASRLALLDLRQGRALGELVLDPDPRDLEIDEPGDWLAVHHPRRALVTLVNLHPRRLLPTGLPARSEGMVAVEAGPLEMAFGRHRVGGGESPVLFLSNGASGTLSAVRWTSQLRQDRVRVPRAGALAVSPGGRRLFVALRGAPEVQVRELPSLELRETLPLSFPATRLVWAGRHLWAVDARGRIQPVEGSGPITSLPTGSWKAVVPQPRTDLLWALGCDPNCLLLVHPSLGRVVGQVPVPPGCSCAAVVPVDGANGLGR